MIATGQNFYRISMFWHWTVKNTSPLLLLALLISSMLSFSQSHIDSITVVDYSRSVEYEIREVTVSGVEYLDKNVLIMMTGFNPGEKVMVPGDKISMAIEKLWAQGLFEDIAITAKKVEGLMIDLKIYLKERPRLSQFSFKGVNQTEADDLRKKISITRGDVVTDNLLINTKYIIRKHFSDKGYLDANIDIRQSKDTTRVNGVNLDILINKGKKVKIYEINIAGNKQFPDQKIKNAMKETKEKGTFTPLTDLPLTLFDVGDSLLHFKGDGALARVQQHLNENVKVRVFKASKFSEDKYYEDKLNIISKYSELGYRDATIVKDSVYRNSRGSLSIDMAIDEGNRYYFRNITWLGNTKYSDEFLSRVLKIQKGDVYNPKLLSENLEFNMSSTDVSSLYLDDGYLFFTVRPVEVLVENDSIDLEIRMNEGKQARISKVTIKGNTRTNDHVIMREIRTRPGQLFSRSDVIRTIRELAQLKYFNPEKINPTPIPNPQDGTVDIQYEVEEVSADQIELSGGWGYGRIMGTLGVSFNNFSLKGLFRGDAWTPVPSGDGQALSLRFSTYGKGYMSYSVSFMEPYLGGKKPNAFSVTYWHSLYSNGLPRNDPNYSSFVINGLTLGLNKRVRWPDDYFSLYQAITIQRYDLYQYSRIFSFGSGNGLYNNFYYTIALSRNSISSPLYPRSGSEVTLSLDITPPYSRITGNEYIALSSDEKYKWIEYYKWKLNMSFYTEIFDKAVVFARTKFGFLGAYDEQLGITPFERFYLGGDGLSGYNNLDGREIIGMRGYGNETITPEYYKNKNIGGTIYSKYTLELRYPLSLNPSSTIYAMAFLEGGNSWSNWYTFSPFSIYRSAGFGLRVFLPMFGLLGLDWGYGFDDVPGIPGANGSQFHFSINSSID